MRNTITSTLFKNSWLAIAAYPILVFLIHSWLAFNHVIGNDEGVALYTGKVILDGGAPYLDSWDHKGPILYFLNAAGFWISQDAVWGPGMLEGLLLAAAISLLIQELKHFWSPYVIYSVVIAFLISYYFFMESLNLTESWTLGFQMIAYLLIWKESNQKRTIDSGKVTRWGLFFSLGLAFSFIFYTRPNNSMGVLFATITLSFLCKKSIGLKGLLVFSLTFFSFSALIAIYLRATKSFSEFIEQFIVYNLDYSSVGSASNRLDASLHSLFRLAQTPLAIFLVITIIFIIFDKTSWLQAAEKAKVNCAILIGLLGDFIFSFLSARGYLHYLIVILPSLMMVVGVFQSYLADRSYVYRRLISFSLAFCILFGGIFGFQKILIRFYSDPGNLTEVSNFLSTNSIASDRIQILGSNTRVLVLANRKSSSSITYSHPATSVFYRNAEQSAWKLEGDIKSRNPKFIVRSTRGSCELNSPACDIGKPQYSEANLAPLYTWILRNYQIIQVIGDYEIWQSRNS